MLLLISDANILIDMEDGNLIPVIFQLPYEIAVPDILFELELRERHSHLLGLFHLFGQFSADCEAPSVAPFSSEIAGAIPSSKVATSGASRLAEILPEKVKKAIFCRRV